MIRIPRPGKDIYSKHISITQVIFYPMKDSIDKELWDLLQEPGEDNWKIQFVDVDQWVNGEPKWWYFDNAKIARNFFCIAKIFTDLLLFKGNFTKITLCIYGNLIRDEYFLSQKCPNFGVNAAIEPMNQSLMQMYGKINAYSKKDVFE